jgi:hypothetical protein
VTPNTIEFKTTSNTLMDGWVMRITADRRIEVNEDVEVTEAAKKVLEAMQWMLDNQKRTWVGLTDEEILKNQDIVENSYSLDLIEFARAIEAKLKEKNA